MGLDMTDDRLVNLEAEKCLLGSMILSDLVAMRMAALGRPDMFWRPAHKIIFRALQTLAETNAGIDFITLKNELGDDLRDAGGDDYLLGIAEFVPSASNYAHYYEIVNQLYARRQLVQLGHDAEKGTWDQDGDALYSLMRPSTAGVPLSIGEIELGARIGRRTVRTGIPFIDSVTDGLDLGEMGVCLMPSGGGKSAFLIGRALHAARERIPVLYLSLADLDEEAIKRRMMRMLCGYSYQPKDEAGAAAWLEALKQLESLDVAIHATFSYRGGNRLRNLIALITEAKRHRRVGMVVIDYVQMIQGEGKNSYEFSVQAEQELRLLTNRLKVATWLGSQATEKESGIVVKGGVHWNEGAALTVVGEFVPAKTHADKCKTDGQYKARTEGFRPLAISCGKSRHSKQFPQVLAGLTDRLEFIEL